MGLMEIYIVKNMCVLALRVEIYLLM